MGYTRIYRILLECKIMNEKRIEILDVPVDVLNMNKAIQSIENKINKADGSYSIFAVNPEKVIALKKDKELLSVFKKSFLLIPDGIGVVWAARFLYGVKIERVPGVDLMHEVCKIAAKKGYGVYLYGAKEKANLLSTRILKEKYKGLKIVGRCNGYIDKEKMSDLIKKINASKADILFVALGSPKQEHWIADNVDKINVKIIQGVGGTLDTITGDVKRAPKVWQYFNLEWFYRLVKDPRRIKRQVSLPIFVSKVLMKKYGFLNNILEK